MRRSARDSDESASRINRRALLLGGAMTAMVAVLGARMRYLGVDQADQFRLLAEENRINIRLIPPVRGLILDRNGKLVAATMLAMFLINRLVLAIAFVPQPGFGFAMVQVVWSIVCYPVVVGLSWLALDIRKPALGEVDAKGRRL